MVNLMLNPDSSTRVFLQDEQATYTYHFFKKLLDQPLYVICGVDAYYTWQQAFPFEENQHYDGIYVVPRRGKNPETNKNSIN